MADKLYVSHPSIPILHSLPKYNKGLFPPPLRPIVSGIGSLGKQLGIFIFVHFQTLVFHLPGFIQDTKHLISLMDGHQWSTDTHWLSCNVSSFYRSIPHDWALVVLSNFFFLARYSNYSLPVKEFLVMDRFFR